MKTKKAENQNLSGVEMAAAAGMTIKHSRANKEEAKAKEKYYCLTKEEYSQLTQALFQVESAVRVVGQNCFENITPTEQDLLDISNILGLTKGNLKLMSTLLAK